MPVSDDEGQPAAALQLLAEIKEGRPSPSPLRCPSCGNTATGKREGAIVYSERIEAYRTVVVDDDGSVIASDEWFDFNDTIDPPDKWVCNRCQHRWPVEPSVIARFEAIDRHPNFRDAP